MVNPRNIIVRADLVEIEYGSPESRQSIVVVPDGFADVIVRIVIEEIVDVAEGSPAPGTFLAWRVVVGIECTDAHVSGDGRIGGVSPCGHSTTEPRHYIVEGVRVHLEAVLACKQRIFADLCLRVFIHVACC